MAGITITVDTGTEFEAGESEVNSICRLDDNTWAIAYRDKDDFDYGKVNIGTRSGTTITMSQTTATIFNNDATTLIEVRPFSSTKILLCYYDLNDTSSPRLRAGTVSGTTITLGTEYDMGTLTDGDVASDLGISIAILDDTNFVVTHTYKEVVTGTVKVAAYVGSVSGTTITLGVEHIIESGTAGTQGPYVRSVGLDSTHYMVVYGLNTVCKGVVGEVNTGTKIITYGTIKVIGATFAPGFYNALAIDKFDSRHIVLLGYNLNFGIRFQITACSIHDTTHEITQGSAVQINGAVASDVYAGICAMDSNHFVGAYRQSDDTAYVRSGYITGSTTVTLDSEGEIQFDTNDLAMTNICRLTDNYFAIAWKQIP